MAIESRQTSHQNVLCLWCRQPIPLPATAARREQLIENEESELRSHVFLLWCEVCNKEGLYLTKDIVSTERFAAQT